MNEKIGLIAGSGQFPVLFSKAALKNGFSVYTVAYLNEADQELTRLSEKIQWLHLGQVKRLIKFFKQNGVNRAVMLGAVRKTRLFTDVKPDMKAISIIAGMRNTHDDAIMRAFADSLEKEHIKIEPSTFLLPELLATKGVWTNRKPSQSEKKDIAMGFSVAKEIGRLDIGQSVVVGGGSILAVEAIDGTDATIQRGGQLGKGEAVLVKVCKPNQDFRFDVPSVGVKTIETMSQYDVGVLAIEADRTVVFDRLEMIRAANENNIAIICE
ncbi:UDP-2,3-diacylglucosamine diphosphatase LpxI domain-containing protein [uncultured Desulfosarcina sp.]|uniref:LpxI family protein n=1 Tax=uncultured Desulfosarcina sp. TaxID=218289 RepID=UPI0029C70120|nr:UDP-2,3-diacylglucosamine diphosphatase LpxI [uncultured Desulfosarcina sp.]